MLSDATSSKLKSIFSAAKIVVIDEAQRIPNIGLTLKLIVDQIPDVQLIATGSSAFDLANKLQEPLTGRKFEYNLYPLCFEELKAHYGLVEEQRMLEDRLIYGSYPEIVTAEGRDKKELITLLSSSYQ
jgi:predicted AAA+ superfamily ATPase